LDREGSVVVGWTMGIGWTAIDFVGLDMNCCAGLERDVRISKSFWLIFSLSVFNELSSSDETIKSSSDNDDRDNDELSWSDSMRIGSNISLVFVGGI
jgi:hypothetical protein